MDKKTLFFVFVFSFIFVELDVFLGNMLGNTQTPFGLYQELLYSPNLTSFSASFCIENLACNEIEVKILAECIKNFMDKFGRIQDRDVFKYNLLKISDKLTGRRKQKFDSSLRLGSCPE